MPSKFIDLVRVIKARMQTSPSEQLTAPKVRTAVWFVVGLLWGPWFLLGGLTAIPSLAWASPDLKQALESPLNVSLVLVALAILLSSLSAATALLIRLDRELSQAQHRTLPHMAILCAWHMAGGWCAGTVAFMTAQTAQMDVWTSLIGVVLASFSGAKFLEFMAERYMTGKFPPPAGTARGG
ncbi:hypothetical protein EC845_1209 [Comamonas sp. BIGb0124]|uniref:hypothetical protein n=1 Tax=Comamonas sp. BIGb0124 TaxID=2485130 RepID=UPI000F960033|nr:hypothetical protein [Comamonas sp. BIGb0124]ROR25169.1 hypothetical protein EC845_1209 [Comamonas sp. BIGb0124]